MIAWRRAPAPPGYVREWRAGDVELVALPDAAPALREALREGSLWAWASHAPDATPMRGRSIAYAVPLPGGGPRVVVRHAQHGGLLAPLTGDRFLAPTRAPRELETARRLARLGLPTPEIVGYATYPAGGPFRRADVATREVPDARDLAAFLLETPPGDERDAAWQATAGLLGRLADEGVRHPDLNAANVLLAPDENGTLDAWVIDVDRVWFDEAGRAGVGEANARRLLRSLRKWRDQRGAMFDEGELERVAAALGMDGTGAA